MTIFIEFHIEGHESPQIVEVGRMSSVLAVELERKGKKFRLGRITK